MKIGLRVLAAICAVCVVLVWVGMGANRGWTKTSTAIPKVDPVTEIEFVEYEEGFTPGVDFLVAGLIGSFVLLGISLVPFPKNKKP